MSVVNLSDPASRGTAVAVHYRNTLTLPGVKGFNPLDEYQVACIVADLLDALEAANGCGPDAIDTAVEMHLRGHRNPDDEEDAR